MESASYNATDAEYKPKELVPFEASHEESLEHGNLIMPDLDSSTIEEKSRTEAHISTGMERNSEIYQSASHRYTPDEARDSNNYHGMQHPKHHKQFGGHEGYRSRRPEEDWQQSFEEHGQQEEAEESTGRGEFREKKQHANDLQTENWDVNAYSIAEEV